MDKYFDEIIGYAHFWDWAPDWNVVKDIYMKFPESYSVLLPFVYTYLEEVIRSTTSQYGYEPIDSNGEEIVRRATGKRLLNIAKQENADNPQYTAMLDIALQYYNTATKLDVGNNRNGVLHGFSHPRFWDKESFEELIKFISKISKFAKF